MRVHVHTKFCFLCVLTFLFHQCDHCHGDRHSHKHDGHPHDNHNHSDLQISKTPSMKATTALPVPRSSKQDPLEEEQRYYIQKLFTRYGQKDRLDFQEFQELLSSLGLGEVKMVDAHHEELGHDHVAHLDLLDLKKGRHSHSGEGHHHEHDHSHHKPRSQHPHNTQAPTRCSHTPADTSSTATPRKHHSHSKEEHDEHEHLHPHEDEHKHEQDETSAKHLDLDHKHDHDHDHNHGLDHDHDHDHDHNHGLDHDHDHDHDHNHGLDHDHSHDPDHDKDHNHDLHLDTSTVPSPDQHLDLSSTHSEPSIGSQSSPTPTQTRSKRPRKPSKLKGQRESNKTPSGDNEQERSHDHPRKQEHSSSHKDKREVSRNPIATASTVHPGGLMHQHEECLNLTELLNHYGLNPDSLISPSQFTYLCPALLYQIDSRVCIRHYHQMKAEMNNQNTDDSENAPNFVWVWTCGFVSITIISLLSLLGVVLVPILKQSCFKFLLTFLVALAVGTLSGDALLHLLPHSQGKHDHSHGQPKPDLDLLTEFDAVWKGLVALAGIYLLFIIEHCLGMFKHYKDQSILKKTKEEGKIGRKLSDHQLNRRSDAEWLHLKPLNEDPDSTVVSCESGHNDTQLTELQTPDSPTAKTLLAPATFQPDQPSPTKENGRKAKAYGHSHSHGHSHGGNCHSDQEMKDAGIASIAWMVIMGDGMHNFSDGLAIGAAFSANVTGGISTSVAVFCHELPHELGDFAVLLKAGMTVKQAIVYNLLSALMAYVGMVIGTAVGQYTNSVTNWIFAITAGMFLYVALVDMLPEMLHGDSEEHKRCHVGHFILQNLGMLTGFSIMLLIAIFEDDIVFDFGL